MLSPAKSRRLNEPIAVSLDELVPRDNFYRRFETAFDLSFVREWVQERYAERGQSSIAPVVLFKLQLILFFEGIRSERKLIEMVSLNAAHRWYVGYVLRGSAGSFQSDPHPPAPRNRHLPTLVREDRRSL